MKTNKEANSTRRVTLEDLAQVAGISRSAASKAMRNHPEVSKATQLRVQQLAKKLGYVRDPALSRLAHYRWSSSNPRGETVAFVYPFHSQHKYDEFFCEAFERVATEHGFSIFIVYARDYTPSRLRSILKARGIRGVVIQRIVDQKYIHELMKDDFVCVTIGEGKVLAPCEMIRADYLWCIPDAIRRHHKAGHKRLVLLLRNGNRDTALAAQMEAVWKYAGLPKSSIIYHHATKPEGLSSKLIRTMPDGIVSFIWTELPESFTSLNGGFQPNQQIALRLIGESLALGNGYYLGADRIALRALHYIESRLVQIGQDKLFGTTLIRPDWIDGPSEI